MQVKHGKPSRSWRLKTTGVELSREARTRLCWMDFYRESENAALTCRHFGISRQTFYRWHRRYDAMDLTSLESGSHRPRRCRRPTWPFLLEEKVLTLRLQFPRWGKDKLVVLLRREKLSGSTSMVGRILAHLKQQGRLVEAPRTGVKGSRRALPVRPYAVRKPKQYAVQRPGDLVQVDTMDVRPVPGVVFKQFTARDLVSHWDVLQAHSRATAQSATEFLDTLTHRMPFPLRALQVDGGSEFAAEFELACQQRGLRLFVLPPRSPKLNGSLERANRTHTEEFYQVTPYSLELRKLNRELRDWERTYNTVRPHQALGYLTPHQFLQQLSSQRKE
jgi:transposase InsO family protein